MNSTELLDLCRIELRDVEVPYLVEDAQIYAYIDDAQKWFCRLTEGIEDSQTAGITHLDVTTGAQWYATSPLILKLREVHRTDTGEPIELINAEKATKLGIKFDGRFGTLKYMVTGLQKNQLRAWPVPAEDMTLELRVFRLPLTSITDAGDQDFEIDEQHHLALLHWVKHRIYDNHDVELFDRRKSDDYKAKFEQYCFQARKEQERARRAVGTVLYGGL